MIHNPSAGAGQPSADELVRAVRAAGLVVRYADMKRTAWRDLLHEAFDLVVAAGGDGTLAKVVRALPNRAIPVLALPLGTANNIARSFGIGGGVAELAAAWREARPRRLDIGRAVGPWGRRRFIEGVGLGCLTDANQAADEAEMPSHARSAMARDRFRRLMEAGAARRFQVVADGQPVSGPALLVEVLNIARAGPGVNLAPDADPGDGWLDVVWLPEARRAEMCGWLGGGSPRAAPPVERRRARRVEILWTDEPLRVDDEFPSPPGAPTPLVVDIEPLPALLLAPATLEPAA